MIIPMDFPEELVTEILSRLPVKSLMRFKCVSKSWCNRISTKDFTFLHSTNYKPSDPVVSGIADESQPWNLLIASVSQPIRACAEESAASAPFVSRIVSYLLPQKKYEYCSRRPVSVPEVCGPCNGIFCFFKRYEEQILLWNPVIQDFKFVPESNLPRQAVQGAVCVYMVGFGFDSETNDHKILQIVRNTCIQEQLLEIYSLATNSWKKLDASPVDSICVGPLFTTRRKIGWLGIKREIYLFDVGNETFDMIPISLEDDAYTRAILEVFPFRESIAVVISPVMISPQVRRPYYEIWVLNDLSCCTQSRSWSKLWTIQLENLYHPLGFCGNSYLIFQGRDSYKLKLYNLVNHDVVDVGASMITAHAYKESLVSISGDEEKKKKKVLDSIDRLVL